MNSHQKKAYKEALKSNLSHKVGAVLVKNNKIISFGHNQLRHQSSIISSHWLGSLHAEINVILEAIRKTNLNKIKGSILFVVRVKKSGEIGLSLPCDSCFDIIQKFKIKKVIFSNNKNSFSEIKV